jgi:hypothetical protein
MGSNRENMPSNPWWFARGKSFENHTTRNFAPGLKNQLKNKGFALSGVS